MAKLPVLLSYAYLKSADPERVEQLMTDERFELLIDSGAFSAFNAGFRIELADYMQWLARWRDHVHGYLALDVVRDPEGTERNLRTMIAEGFNPIPVHVFGDDQARLDDLFGLSEWVALAGFRRPHRGHAPRSYVAQKMEWASGRQVHWLGYTKQEMLMQFLPYSCDSASWKSGEMWGLMTLYLGKGRWANVRYNEIREHHRWMDPDIRRAVESYGYSIDQFLDPVEWRKVKAPHGGMQADSMVCKLPARSWVRYALEFQQRFGPRIYLAAAPDDYIDLVDAYAYEEAAG